MAYKNLIHLNIQRFGASCTLSRTTTQNYVNNTSTIKYTATVKTDSSTYNNDSAYVSGSYSGGASGTLAKRTFGIGRSSSVSRTWTITVKHNSDGTIGAINFKFKWYVTNNFNGTKSVSFTPKAIPRSAMANNMSGNNIDGTFKVSYTAPSTSLQYKLRVYIPNGDTIKTIDNYTSDSEFSFTTNERNLIYSKITTTSQITIAAVVETWNGSTKIGDSNEVNTTANLTNANPTFNNFDFEDMNPITLELTGNSKINVNGYTQLRAKINLENKAVAIKNATMSKYRLVVGNQSVDIPYSATTDVIGILNNSSSGVYNMYAIDSRGNSTLVTKQADSVIEYEPIVLETNASVERTDGIGEDVTLSFNGKIWLKSFGEVMNNIKSVKYYFKLRKEEEYIEGSTPINIEVDENGNFSFRGEIFSNEEGHLWSIQNSYDIQLEIKDELSTVTRDIILSTGIPHIAFADNGVAIMSPYIEEVGGLLQVGGQKIL